MKDLFLAKIFRDNAESLIFTDGKKYSFVKTHFPEIITFSSYLHASDLKLENISLDNELTPNTIFLNLIESEHIFATGCTFLWSQEKLVSTADSDNYKNIYLSERSMFFYKGNANNMASNNGKIGLRSDSTTTIPEGEIIAVFNSTGKIIGYTIGNDVTAVDIEKQNPLFQMQAKFYKGSVSLLPMIKLGAQLPATNINCRVVRNNETICETTYSTQNFVRSPQEIVNQLNALELTADGGFLFLGCGASYPKDKKLSPNDIVIIQSDFLPIPLQNSCEYILNKNPIKEL